MMKSEHIPGAKIPRKKVDGVLLLDKPEGISSNAALQRARRLFQAEKAGHAGTLDPLASGLLPLCFGEASKFSSDLLNADKTYVAEIVFGIATTTGDREGEITSRAPQALLTALTAREIEAVLPKFTGELCQIPPMYSALKRDGQPLYALARQGITVERKERPVTIHALRCLDFSPATLPRCRLEVHCGKGTYIRVLAEDIGKALGCGASLYALRRTRVGRLRLEDAEMLSPLEDLAARNPEKLAESLLPVDALLSTLPSAYLAEAERTRFICGNPVACPVSAPKKADIEFKVYDMTGSFLGSGQIREDGKLWPKRLLARILP
ncbi:MAG: tRNA pseudouridine(55) synthase TruB [Zoogloeaceae bacterium]|nr:tRNA pseudouridine(55) synthase TruB [Zoogloeaceae bacterium]